MNDNDSSIPKRRRATQLHPSAFLLAAQLLSLVLYAQFDGHSTGSALLSAFGILVLALIVWVVNHSPGLNWIAWLLVVPAVILSILTALVISPSIMMWSSLVESVLYFYATGSLIAYMMQDDRVTTDELFAAGATFTLLAWAFAYAYQVCQVLDPASFIGAANPGQPRTFVELLSLSFTNLSATGLGDVLPMTAPARVLVMLEQFAGVGYIAMVVSRLVGMTVSSRGRRLKLRSASSTPPPAAGTNTEM